MPSERREKLISLATKTDRTLFFDFFPLKLGNIGGYQTRFHLYTVPGQVFYNSTRKVVLTGVDALVFVADAQKRRLDANIESLENLQENLAEKNLSLDTIPFVIQYNKMDMPNLESIDRLNKFLNPRKVPYYKAIAITGMGVWDTLKGTTNLMLDTLSKKGTFAKLGVSSKRRIERKKKPAEKERTIITPPENGWGDFGATEKTKEIHKPTPKPPPKKETPLIEEGISLPRMENGLLELDTQKSTYGDIELPSITDTQEDLEEFSLPDFDGVSEFEDSHATAETSIGIDLGGSGNDFIKKRINVPLEISTKNLPAGIILDISLNIKFKK